MRHFVQTTSGRSPRSGIGLLEVLVALLLLAGGMLAVTSAGGAVIKQRKVANADVEFWGALQTVGDSLQQLGHGNVQPRDSLLTVGNYGFTWTVENPGGVLSLDLVTIRAFMVHDSTATSEPVLIYLADL